MPRQCQFPVQFSDNRRCYRSGTTPGFAVGFAIVAALSGYAGFSHAATVVTVPAPVGKTFLGYAKGRLLIAPRAGLSDVEFDKVLKSINGKALGKVKKLNLSVVSLPSGVDEIATMNKLKNNRKLKYVELDMAIRPSGSVSDPAFGSSWALPKIGVPSAWDNANGSGIVVAVLDTGVDGTHPDLATNMVAGWNFYDNNSNTADVYGHGTMVAGTVAAVANDGIGSAGVAWGAKIMPVRISAPDGTAYWSTVAQGIDWAADNGARVVNVSYNGVSGSATVQSAADYMRSKGGVVVVAAGNSGAFDGTAASDSLLSISATDANDALTSFSSYGAYVDLAAPGVNIYTTARGGGYANASGTSFSSPVVAGTVALMLAANGKLAPANVDSILKSTALDLGTAGYDQSYGYGRVNAAAAVASAKAFVASDTQPPTIAIAAPTGGKVSGIVPVDVKYADNVGVARIDLYANGALIASDTASPFAFSWDTDARPDGAYTLTAQAFDAAGNKATSAGVAVTIGNDTTPPVITSFNLTQGMVISPSKQMVSAAATDNTQVAQISLTLDGKQVAVTYGASISYNWNTRKLGKGTHTATVRAVDTAGNAVSKSVSVTK
jgi:hypothetical protein